VVTSLDSLIGNQAALDTPAESTRVSEIDSTSEQTSKPLYYSGVNIRRLGDFRFPVELEVVFDNGEIIREDWDGQDLWKKFRYLKPVKLASATIDPDRKIVMDVNFTNNSKSIEAHSKGINKLTTRFLFWCQFIMDQPEILSLLSLFQ
ncbi:MAG: hypothetical protein GWN62_04935, partial [Aliifodinibius sp.]|nr:hypothetical protein [Fodinibius sp.]